MATSTCAVAWLVTDPEVKVFGEDAHYDTDTETISFASAGFDLPTRPARGSAEQLEISSDSRVSLSNVLFTTCPPDNVAWELSAREIDLDVNAGVGKARGVKLDFKGVPILYAPYFSFPINDERKSGFLVPDTHEPRSHGLRLDGALLPEPRAELRLDARAALHEQARHAGAQRLPLPDAEQPRRARLRVHAGRQRDARRRAAT